ncbi:MAG: acetoin utilization protein AcuC [Promethearchaeati archaeon SRVP18_Atabeyarchaeia-1]
MSGKTVIIYSDDFMKYDFGPSHPLRPIRLKLTFELLKATGVLNNPLVGVQLPRQANEGELLMVHSREYVEEVKAFSRTGAGYLDAGDTPAFKGIHEATAMAVGGSLVAADLVMKGEATHAFNPAGGLHHAGRDHAAGFCVYNDIAVAIRHIQKAYGVRKVAVVDVDVHHGDGTQAIFYSDPTVLGIDFHEDGTYLYPGSGSVRETGEGAGRGYKVNIPLPPLTGSECYLHAFDEVTPALIRAFKPEIIVNQFGADTHYDDPLAHLSLTMDVYGKIASRLHSLAHEVCGGKYLVLGGGGYKPESVARVWTTMFSNISESTIPDKIPEEWVKFCREKMKREPPTTFSDEYERSINNSEREKITWTVEQTLKEIKSKIFPAWRI